MSIGDVGKKAVRFTFISMPLSILGANQLKMGNQYISNIWKTLLNPVCPECDKGVLSIKEKGTQVLDGHKGVNTEDWHSYSWVCGKCGFTFIEKSGDIDRVRKATARYRNERIKTSLTEMERSEIERITRGHYLHSRVFFFASMFAIIGFIYMLASGATFILALNWLSIAFVLWILGMKKSYRSWQVKTRHLFVKGAFWLWFKHEKWVV